MKMGKEGISLMSLVVTIIVIIILAAMAIFNGLNTPDQAMLAKFSDDLSMLQETVYSKFNLRYAELVEEGEKFTEPEIYCWLATGDSSLADEDIVEIDSNNHLEITLPFYADRNWKIRTSDGMVFIDPPISYNGNLYSSLENIKNGGVSGATSEEPTEPME